MQELDRKRASDVCCFGVAQAVEQEEVVDHAPDPDGGDVDTGFADFGGVLLAFIAENVCFIGDHQGGRQSLELVERMWKRPRAMHVHRNSVRHRVSRFQEFTGLDIQQTDDLITTWWLLKWRYASGEGARRQVIR